MNKVSFTIAMGKGVLPTVASATALTAIGRFNRIAQGSCQNLGLRYGRPEGSLKDGDFVGTGDRQV